MAQWLAVSVIVAAAAGWTVWNLFLRGLLVRRARAASPGGRALAGGCGGDCACED
jgi:hypothetical protein